MTIDALIMFLGVLIAILPFLGFPVSWDSAILLFAGMLIIFLGIIVRRRGLVPRVRPVRKQNVYVESVPPSGPHERA